MQRLIPFLVALLLAPASGCLSGEAGPRTDPGGDGDGQAPQAAPTGSSPEADSNRSEASSNGTDDGAGDGGPNATETEGADDTGGNRSANPTAGPEGSTHSAIWGCEQSFAMLEAPRTWAQDRVPEPLEPHSFFSPGALAPQSGVEQSAKVSFVAASAHCETWTLDGAGDPLRVEDADRFWYGVFVEPPEAYTTEAIKMHLYPLRMVVDDPRLADRLEAWDLPVETGNVTLTVNADRREVRSWTVTGETPNASLRLDLETAMETPPYDEKTTFRFFGTPQGGTIEHAVDTTLQPNTTQSPTGVGAYPPLVHLDAPDSPYATPTPGVLGNMKFTPSGAVAEHARLVDLPELGGGADR